MKKVTIEQLADYIFQQLPDEQEAELEKLLDEDPETARMVDGMLAYVKHEELKSKAELLDKLQSEKNEFYSSHIQQNRNDTNTTKTLKAPLLLLFIITLAILLGIYWFTRKTATESSLPQIALMEQQNLKTLEQLSRRDQEKYRTASLTEATWWQQYLDENFIAAKNGLVLLYNKNQQYDYAFQYYYDGVLHLYLSDGNLTRSINSLTTALSRGYGEDTPVHLITAYLLNQQPDEARQLQQRFPNVVLPEYIEDQLSN